MSATALGIVPDGSPVTRLGCEPEDRLFASGPVGLGSAFAVLQLEHKTAVEGIALEYRPHARLREGQLLRGFATCCMDSSDGIIPTLDELSQLNGIGFQLDMEVEELLHPGAVRLAAAVKLPPWMMLAGPHGEFELLFTVAPDRRDGFVANAVAHGWEPLEIGTVVPENGLGLAEGGPRLDTGRIRNLFMEVDGDVGEYVRALLRLGGC
jgi:thiamine-monophosphate kinase